MKIHSAYMQNQVPKTAQSVRSSDVKKIDHFDKMVDHSKSSDLNKSESNVDQLSLSEVTARILSQNEKHYIAASFSNTEQKFRKTYTEDGRSVNMEIILGKKIDIKG